MTVGLLVPPPPWAGWSPFGPSWSSRTPISASGSLREASMARMGGCLWMQRYGWVQDAAMAAGVGRGESTEGLDDNADCRGRSSTGGAGFDPKAFGEIAKSSSGLARMQRCRVAVSLAQAVCGWLLDVYPVAAATAADTHDRSLAPANRWASFPSLPIAPIHPLPPSPRRLPVTYFPRRPFSLLGVSYSFRSPSLLRAPARPHMSAETPATLINS